MTDRFKGRAAGFDSPASHAFTITPNDGSDLSEVTRALYVGTGGTIAVVMHSGAPVSFTSVPDGAVLPVRVARVKATGTTAAAILGLV